MTVNLRWQKNGHFNSKRLTMFTPYPFGRTAYWNISTWSYLSGTLQQHIRRVLHGSYFARRRPAKQPKKPGQVMCHRRVLKRPKGIYPTYIQIRPKNPATSVSQKNQNSRQRLRKTVNAFYENLSKTETSFSDTSLRRTTDSLKPTTDICEVFSFREYFKTSYPY